MHKPHGRRREPCTHVVMCNEEAEFGQFGPEVVVSIGTMIRAAGGLKLFVLVKKNPQFECVQRA